MKDETQVPFFHWKLWVHKLFTPCNYSSLLLINHTIVFHSFSDIILLIIFLIVLFFDLFLPFFLKLLFIIFIIVLSFRGGKKNQKHLTPLNGGVDVRGEIRIIAHWLLNSTRPCQRHSLDTWARIVRNTPCWFQEPRDIYVAHMFYNFLYIIIIIISININYNYYNFIIIL